MDFTLDDEQQALRDAVRGQLGRTYGSTEARRRTVGAEPGYDEHLWRRLAELGILALPFPEEAGGAGAGPMEVAVVAEELGRVLAPEPFVEAVVLAGGLIAEAGTPEQQQELIAALGAGELLPVFAGMEPGGRWQAAASTVTADQDGDRWTVTGVKEPVVFGARADLFVVSATVPAGTGLFLVEASADGVSRTGYPSADGGRAALVSFDRTAAVPLGEPGRDQTALIDRVWDRARLAYAHEILGALEPVIDTTVGYLKTRRQFGATLSTFQALSHRAAELYVALELARSTITWASIVRDAEHGGDDTVDVPGAVSQASLQAFRAARLIGQEAIQLHGGIGMTAEYGIGHYTSRLTVIERLAGDSAFHRARLSEALADHAGFDPIG